MLDSVLTHIRNDTYYPELLDKLTQLVFGINKNHVFHDGNKRASIALSCFFLELNGYDFAIKQYTRGMEDVAVWLASSLIDQLLLKKIICFLLTEDIFHVEFFIEEAKKHRFLIEKNLIEGDLLSQMIDEWLSDSMALSEQTKLRLLDALDKDSRSV